MRIVSFFFFFIFFLDYGKISFMIASFTFSVSRTKGSFGSVTFVSRNFKNGAILACRGVIDKSKIASHRAWMASDRGTRLYRTGARNWRSFRPSLFTSSFSFRLLFGAKKEFVFTRRFTDECFPYWELWYFFFFSVVVVEPGYRRLRMNSSSSSTSCIVVTATGRPWVAASEDVVDREMREKKNSKAKRRAKSRRKTLVAYFFSSSSFFKVVVDDDVVARKKRSRASSSFLSFIIVFSCFCFWWGARRRVFCARLREREREARFRVFFGANPNKVQNIKISSFWLSSSKGTNLFRSRLHNTRVSLKDFNYTYRSVWLFSVDITRAACFHIKHQYVVYLC